MDRGQGHCQGVVRHSPAILVSGRLKAHQLAIAKEAHHLPMLYNVVTEYLSHCASRRSHELSAHLHKEVILAVVATSSLSL